MNFLPSAKCDYCRDNPNSHSFKRLMKPDGHIVFYSKVAAAELYNNTESILHHFRGELQGVGHWYWIFDCREMGFKHYIQFGLVRELAKLIESHGGLRKIYLLDPSWLIHMSIQCAGMFMTLPDIIYVDTPPVDLALG